MVFKLIFKEILEKDKFQIMYEAYVDENKKLIETGNILFANLILRVKIIHFFILMRRKILDIMIKMARVLKKP